MSLEDTLLKLIVKKPKRRRVFEMSLKGVNSKIIGEETEVTLKMENSKDQGGLRVNRIALTATAGGNYMLVDDASRKYGLSKDKIRRLCRERKIECEKKPNRLWLVKEDSLIAYVSLVN